MVGCASAPPRSPYVPQASVASAQQSADAAVHAIGLVGTPYSWGGNTIAGGFDCSGLIAFVYRTSAGIKTPRTVSQMAGFGDLVEREDLRTGDLVLFGGASPTHAGIYVGEGRFVHAPSSGGTVRLDRLDSPYWAKVSQVIRRP